jgi:hypothetical protein
MYDDAGFLVLSSFGALAVLSSFAALLWAAVQDGRDEAAFSARATRARRP